MEPSFDAAVAPMTNPAGVEVVDLDPTHLSGGRMKGFALVHLVELMDQQDLSLWDEWRAQWPSPHRERLERHALRATQWFPMEYYFHGVSWLTRRSGGLRQAISVGYEITTADISVFFRFVAAMASPTTVLALAQRLWSSYFERSTVHVTRVSETSAVVEVRDWPLANDPVSLHELAGSFFAFGEVSRAQEMRMERLELTGPGQFTFVLRWR